MKMTFTVLQPGAWRSLRHLGYGGRKVGDLLDVITANSIRTLMKLKRYAIKNSSSRKAKRRQIVLTNALLGFDRSIVTDVPNDRDSIDSVLKYYGEEIILIDTAGLRRKSKISETIEFFSSVRTLKQLQKAIYHCNDRRYYRSRKSGSKILEEAIRRRRGIIIAVNKWILSKKTTALQKNLKIK